MNGCTDKVEFVVIDGDGPLLIGRATGKAFGVLSLPEPISAVQQGM